MFELCGSTWAAYLVTIHRLAFFEGLCSLSDAHIQMYGPGALRIPKAPAFFNNGHVQPNGLHRLRGMQLAPRRCVR